MGDCEMTEEESIIRKTGGKTMKKGKLMKAFFVLTLIMIMMSNTLLVSADISLDASDNATLISNKIDPELREIMDEADENELISVWVSLKRIDHDKLRQIMIKKYDMDVEVFEDSSQFEKKVLPQIEAEVIAEKGIEAAYEPITYEGISATSAKVSLLNNEENSFIYEITPIDEAVAEKYDEFLSCKRSVIKQEYTAMNNSFIEENNISEDNLVYVGRHISTVILKATKSDILKFQSNNNVEEITYCNDVPDEPAIDDALDQVGVYSTGGTGNSSVDGWLGHNGLNIKVGIVESAGRYDSTAAMLAHNNRITFLENIKSDGTSVPYSITDHATCVTSIIAGMTQVVNGTAYTGVVPGATVYQIPSYYVTELLNALDILAEKGVHVINLSLGGSEEYYTSLSRDVDEFVADNNIVVVAAANNSYLDNEGNRIDEEASRYALAYNTISVGNVATIDISGSPYTSPFSMHISSSYIEPYYIPNVPDIAAPGTNLHYVKVAGRAINMGTGTSASAPIVTGIVAQMMQAQPSLRGNPTEVKAALLLGADRNKITATNNPVVRGTAFRDRSGIGMVNAINAVNNAYSSTKITEIADYDEGKMNMGSYYFHAGQIVKVIMVFSKENTLTISSTNYENTIDNIDLWLTKSDTQRVVKSSSDNYNNVEYLEYYIQESGYYDFEAVIDQVGDMNKQPKISIVFNVEEI